MENFSLAMKFTLLTIICLSLGACAGTDFGASSNFTKYENVPIPRGDPRGVKCGRECQEWLVRP